MMPTAEQSAELKGRFKDFFYGYGYDAPLPADLAELRGRYPLEWGEACEEYKEAKAEGR